MPRPLLILIAAACACGSLFGQKHTLTSGEPVRIANADQTAPLSVGLSNMPTGAAFVTGGDRPDLFVSTGRHSRSPGFYLLRYVRDKDGVPVFGAYSTIPYPYSGRTLANGDIWQDKDGAVYAFWIKGKTLLRTRLDPILMEFSEFAPPLELNALPRGAAKVAVRPNANGSLTLLLAVGDGTRSNPPGGIGWREKEYRPYDGALIFRGELGYIGLYSGELKSVDAPSVEKLGAIEGLEHEALNSFADLAWAPAPPAAGWVGGTRMGLLQFYPVGTDASTVPTRLHATDVGGIILRHPTINATPIAYPSADGGQTDLIVGGEGALYYYRSTGKTTPEGAPVYQDPQPVLLDQANLFTGTLPVLSTGDLTGNGVDDLLVGNSEGKILFFANKGSNEAPVFEEGFEVFADGEPIHIQQGYVGVQGPQEHRWGYVSPRLFDWDGDGRLDIVMSSATAVHQIYPNIGTRTEPKFGKTKLLYRDGLPLYGTWRMQPAVARIGDKILYVYLDQHDEIRAAWKIDDQNLRDGGKLRFADTGTPIRGNRLEAGGSGRLKLNLVDWDGDGVLDLLIGTPRHGLVSDDQPGLLEAMEYKGGASVMFLKNLGTNEEPVYARPTLMKFRGEPIFLGGHECSPVATRLGAQDSDGPNLMVGDQEGIIFYYDRKDLSWD